MKAIDHYGDSGILVLPSQDFFIPLYNGNIVKNSQTIVDREDSAVIKRRHKGGHCDVIADHAYQGFDIIRECKINQAAVIQTPTSTRIYRWAATLLGKNTGKSLVTCFGQAVPKIKWADLCMYTCNDDKGRDITMVFFKFQEELKWTIYKVGENAQKEE